MFIRNDGCVTSSILKNSILLREKQCTMYNRQRMLGCVMYSTNIRTQILCLQYVELDNILINEYLARIAHIILRVINYPYICHLGSLLAEP